MAIQLMNIDSSAGIASETIRRSEVFIRFFCQLMQFCHVFTGFLPLKEILLLLDFSVVEFGVLRLNFRPDRNSKSMLRRS
jgi:hypothetical protein